MTTLDYHAPQQCSKPKVSTVAWAISAANLTVSAGLAILIFRSNGINHISTDPRWLWIWPAFVATLLFSSLAGRTINKRSAWTLAISLLLIATALFVIDYFNLLVNYDLWCARGMPDPWKHLGAGSSI